MLVYKYSRFIMPTHDVIPVKKRLKVAIFHKTVVNWGSGVAEPIFESRFTSAMILCTIVSKTETFDHPSFSLLHLQNATFIAVFEDPIITLCIFLKKMTILTITFSNLNLLSNFLGLWLGKIVLYQTAKGLVDITFYPSENRQKPYLRNHRLFCKNYFFRRILIISGSIISGSLVVWLKLTFSSRNCGLRGEGLFDV